MIHVMRLPELAESVVEGEILHWLVAEGEPVVKDQPLIEVMTDKVTVELPATASGVLKRHLVRVGDLVAVHTPVAEIEEKAAEAVVQPSVQRQTATPPGVTPPTADNLIPDAGEGQSLFKAFGEAEVIRLPSLLAGRGAGLAVAAPPAATVAPPAASSAPANPAPGGRQRAVPSARRLARSLGLDLTEVAGSGPNGRIRPQDVQDHHIVQTQRPPAAPPASRPISAHPPGGLPVPPVTYRTPAGYESQETRTPLRGLRRAISNQLLASHLYTVRTLTVDEANLTRLVELRARLNVQLGASGVKLSYLPFIFKAIASALRQYPSLNTSFDEVAQEIVQKHYVNLGLAVTTDAGLIVPVVRDVERKSIVELAAGVADLAARARDGQLRSEELSGSSFSVTNIGTIGALFSFPIINVPDAAILGVHSIVRRPICDPDGQIVAADMMYLSLSFDHRLVDGADAARFCKAVIRSIEHPEMLLIGAQ